MTKEQKTQIVAWGIYFAFMSYYITAIVTGSEFLARHAELVVNIYLWVFTLIPAIFAIGSVSLIRRNFPAMLKEMRKSGATEEQIVATALAMSPKMTKLNYLSFVSSGLLLAVVWQLGFPVQAVAMWSISMITQAVMILLPLKEVDSQSIIA